MIRSRRVGQHGWTVVLTLIGTTGWVSWRAPRPDPDAVSGCYALAYGAWFPYGHTRANGNTPLPTALELRSEARRATPDDTARLVSSVPREDTRNEKTIWPVVWYFTAPESLSVFWDPTIGLPNALSLGGQTSFQFRVRGDTLDGIADFQTDPLLVLGDPWARVRAVRAPCGDTTTSAWGERRAALNQWAQVQHLDTALGVQRAISAFDRYKHQSFDVGPTVLIAFVSSYYQAHGRLPRTAAQAYPSDSGLFRLLPRALFLRNTNGIPYLYRPHGKLYDVTDLGPNGKPIDAQHVWRNLSPDSMMDSVNGLRR